MEKIIHINASAFVIPNRATKIDDFFGDERKEYSRKLANLNNTEIDDSDKLVQLWLHNKEELGCDNIARHPLKITLDDSREIILRCYDLEYFPAKLLQNIKEGETIQYKAPYNRDIIEIIESGKMVINDIEIIIDITMKCQQQGYRYQRFGNFEDIVSEVIK